MFFDVLRFRVCIFISANTLLVFINKSIEISITSDLEHTRMIKKTVLNTTIYGSNAHDIIKSPTKTKLIKDFFDTGSEIFVKIDIFRIFLNAHYLILAFMLHKFYKNRARFLVIKASNTMYDINFMRLYIQV